MEESVELQTKIEYDYEPNYFSKFISGSLVDIQSGNTCYVYKQETLNELCEILNRKNIKYLVSRNEDYWCVREKKG